MSFMRPAPKPSTPLGYHRILAPTAGVKVSPICLGAMNFGTSWESFLGECNKDTSFEILDTFFESGGNFIDTANNYQAGESEQWLGEWMEKRKNRDQMVIATKYTSGFVSPHNPQPHEKVFSNFVGNSAKSLHVSVDRSLKNMKTDYIDLLYVHWWDFTTSVEEMMHALNVLVNNQKVLYLGVSDTPAWVVVKANDYARANGLRPFSVYQGLYNAAIRDMEREIIPMCQDQGMALCPWGPIGQGKFKTAEARKANAGAPRGAQMSEAEIHLSETLEKFAEKKKATLHGVALAYVMHKTPNLYPIVGQRSVSHLKANIEALNIRLTDEEIDEIDSAAPFDAGFPQTFFWRTTGFNLRNSAKDLWLTQANVHLAETSKPKAAVTPQSQ